MRPNVPAVRPHGATQAAQAATQSFLQGLKAQPARPPQQSHTQNVTKAAQDATTAFLEGLGGRYAAAAKAADPQVIAAAKALEMVKRQVLKDLIVDGCQDDDTAGIIEGSYTWDGTMNHDRPVYTKDHNMELDVFIYFWDDRDGVEHSGWWFGLEVGGDKVWAYNPEKNKVNPPLTGWQAPLGSDPDEKLRLIPAVQRLVVQGCADPTVAEIVRGVYTFDSMNHDKPVYRKDMDAKSAEGVDVWIYFWDSRDGVENSGWWFGLEIGGDKVWAYHPDKGAVNGVPLQGWVVPFGGEVDRSFRLYPAPKQNKRKAPAADTPAAKVPKAHAELMEKLEAQLKARGGSVQDKLNEEKKKQEDFLQKRKDAQADLFAQLGEWTANPAEATRKQAEKRKKDLEEATAKKKKFMEDETLRKQRADAGVGTWKPPAGSSVTPPPDGKKVGMRVCLQGLTGAPHLNDLEGILVSWLGDKNRWSVRMVTGDNPGECKALKPSNVRLVDEDPS